VAGLEQIFEHRLPALQANMIPGRVRTLLTGISARPKRLSFGARLPIFCQRYWPAPPIALESKQG
jgi:hypothetical protein